MTEANETAPVARKRGGGLSTMLLADLKAMAQGMGIAGAGSMKKAQLVDAIRAAQSGQGSSRDERRPSAPDAQQQDAQQQDAPQQDAPRDKQGGQQDGQRQQGQQKQKGQQNQQQKQGQGKQGQQKQGQGKQGQPPKQQDQQPKQDQQPNKQEQQSKQDKQDPQGDQQGDQDAQGSRRNRRRRGRDRDRRTREPDTTVLEDDVLVPAAGILDVLDNYAFVRTSGYLAGADDVYLSLSMVRKHELRRGDAVVGQVRQPREGERKEKFNPMVRIDSINGLDPEAARDRPEFDTFTPVHPSERLRLETESTNLVGRMIDLVAPIGKGQRGLVVAPPGAGRTTLLQSIAHSVAANNPECHLMVVLVDERPEEVTDFERSVKGEVIASTFDRPPSDHTSVAELAIERAKRLVELGHDVVVLLDSITRLGRAYNVSGPASGRILSGGVDSGALHPPKRFFGAARNIEDGGSLTILAAALVETGSKTDEVIFEELEGTATMVLRLSRELADERLFPAIDAVGSGTRREELLMGAEEQQIVRKLRRLLSGRQPEQALELLLERLRGSGTNIELLTRVQRSTPGPDEG